MADGDQKPIEQVKIGDDVVASDPQTGVTGAKVVTAAVTTPDDEDFTDLSLQDGQASTNAGSGQDATLTTTWHHPFWSVTSGRWEEASSLQVGERLQQPDETAVTVNGVRNYHQQALTYNLTVADFHTYYVLAGATPVLVHNSDCGPEMTGVKTRSAPPHRSAPPEPAPPA
ncbi:polymorphic toxin-type HINT domain-containing protein [Kitasatospora sp. NPDC047058]|uniref:polymorphic toxin-type HINT domain-containing protein n=1 Tax=Kitasatospora sp. NPDC047058 TaxID=3155620 RepID=UPI0033F4C6B9